MTGGPGTARLAEPLQPQGAIATKDLYFPASHEVWNEDCHLKCERTPSDVGGREFRRGVSPAGFECIV